MKRIFYFGAQPKEAPENLRETPQIGSLVAYNRMLYRVTHVIYYLETGSIRIILNRDESND